MLKTLDLFPHMKFQIFPQKTCRFNFKINGTYEIYTFFKQNMFFFSFRYAYCPIIH